MGNTRILLAEDETITRMDLREMLENLGYSVIGEAGDGIAAVNMARALKPDLVLMDIKMPEMDGISAAETLAQEHVTPVLLLTASLVANVALFAAVTFRAGRPAIPVASADAAPGAGDAHAKSIRASSAATARACATPSFSKGATCARI